MEPSAPERDKNAFFHPAALWARLKEHDVLERVLQTVVRLNRERNDDALEYQEYLPPQAPVLRVEYHHKNQILMMELVLRKDGPKAVFYRQKFHGPLLRYFSRRHRSRLKVVLVRRFQPEELTEAEIQEWLSFLLSGFKRLSTTDKNPAEKRTRRSRLSEVL